VKRNEGTVTATAMLAIDFSCLRYNSYADICYSSRTRTSQLTVRWSKATNFQCNYLFCLSNF